MRFHMDSDTGSALVCREKNSPGIQALQKSRAGRRGIPWLCFLKMKNNRKRMRGDIKREQRRKTRRKIHDLHYIL